MESRIPVPTDNIYKFYALFGLLLTIFSIGSVLYVHEKTNALILSSAVEIDTLKHLEKPSRAEAVRLAALERQREVAISDRAGFRWILGALCGIGFTVMALGFVRWHLEVQPILDETSKVQLEIAKLQLEKLRRELNPPPPTELEP